MLLGTLYSKGIPLFVSARFDFAITGILLGFLLLMQFLNLILYVPRVSSLGLHEKKMYKGESPIGNKLGIKRITISCTDTLLLSFRLMGASSN